MPGIVMDDVDSKGRLHQTNLPDSKQWKPSLVDGGVESLSRNTPAQNYSKNRNGSLRGSYASQHHDYATSVGLCELGSGGGGGKAKLLQHYRPPLPHISQGFFPYARLVNRAAQQCWNDLSDLISDLAEVHISDPAQFSQQPLTNGKALTNHSTGNAQKKIRMLEFAQNKRAELIKLLVLSQWGRHAAEVSELIDLQAFIRSQHQAYDGALQRLADIKRDLVRAQVANPDLKTALEVLSTGELSSMSNFGYETPRPLSARAMLKVLRKLNQIISTRLLLHDLIPKVFQDYSVHDGRVTFKVRSEFEIDLAIAKEDPSSQFFFIDIRFLYTPSPILSNHRFFKELDKWINERLQTNRLYDCFEFVHNLVLSHKIEILFRQALQLARGKWFGGLRVELLHRTLVVQYWSNKASPKSWIEIGILSGQDRKVDREPRRSTRLGLRWICENKEITSSCIMFDLENLSLESILQSTVANHTSNLLESAYKRLSLAPLYGNSFLSLRLQTSLVEPGDCYMNVQLTKSRSLCVTVEPISGAVSLTTIPSLLGRLDGEPNNEKNPVDDLVSRVTRMRCLAAIGEVEYHAKIQGWDTVNPRSSRIDIRRFFPSNILRMTFFRHPSWEPNWIIAATTSLINDEWWAVRMRSTSSNKRTASSIDNIDSDNQVVFCTRILNGPLFCPAGRLSHDSFANLSHSLDGFLTILSNIFFLNELQYPHVMPSIDSLKLGQNLQVPRLLLGFKVFNLPPVMRMVLHDKSKNQFVKETIQLSYHGFHYSDRAAILVAEGKIRMTLKRSGLQSPKLDPSIVLQPDGRSFSMRFLTTPGKPVISDLFDRLQKLEIMLSIFQSLERKAVTIKSLSLSRITFEYDAKHNLCATIQIQQQSQPLGDESLEAPTTYLYPSRLSRLNLNLIFSDFNPHRRVKDHLTTVLNRTNPTDAVPYVLLLLRLTLPLMQAFASLDAHHSNSGLSTKVQIVARDTKVYQIRYLKSNHRFFVTGKIRDDQLVWVLKLRESSNNMADKVREKIFNCNGNGWQGLGNGAVASAESVGSLISELNKCMQDIPAVIEDNKQALALVNKKSQNNPLLQQKISTGSGSTVRASQPTVGSRGKKKQQDIITID